MAFKPLEVNFEKGLRRIQSALRKAGVDFEKDIITSRDERIVPLRKLLSVKDLPTGFAMWQLPVVVNKSLLFISVAGPNAAMPEHRHSDAPVFRLVISGSIIYNDIELTGGDWMYVPKGKSYSFKAGAFGSAVMYPHPDPWQPAERH